jgi:CII-binding regulator of phage lambda lysogenization HflD
MTNTNYPSATPQTTPPERRNSSKNIIIGVLAAGLLGTWAYVLVNQSKHKEEIQQSTTQGVAYMTARDSLKALYDEAEIRLDSITGANNNLQGEKTSLQKDIDAKKAEIRRILNDRMLLKAELAKAKNLINELNDQISTLQTQVTELTAANQELNTSNTQLKTEKADLESNLATTTTVKEELEKTVDVGSTFSASNIAIRPVNEKKSGKEKSTTTAKRVDKLVVSFDVENRIAKSGPADLYIIVTAPDGKVISDANAGGGTLTTRQDGDKAFTTKMSIQYDQGTRRNLEFPIRQDNFQIGDYKIEVYHNGFKIGEGVRSLKKGGIFG